VLGVRLIFAFLFFQIASLIPGINTQEFNSCLDSNKHKPLIDSDNILAISSGFQGTPTFVIEKKDGSSKDTYLEHILSLHFRR
jgi:protein-disulfide isomerase